MNVMDTSTVQAGATTGQVYALTESGQPLRPMAVPQAAPAGQEVWLRMLAAGVCHTDLHLSEGYFNLGGGRRMRLVDRGIHLPHVLGHENVGEVLALGPEADGVQVGDRVLVYPWNGCGACERCALGNGHLCERPRFTGVFRAGGFGDFLTVPTARCLFPVHGLDAAAAAPLACSGLTAYSALRKVSAAWSSGPIAIVGAGALGLMCVALLQKMGGHGAIVIEPDAAKRQTALALGARAAFGTDPDARAALAETVGSGLGAVIDFVGSAETVEHGLSLLSKGGRLVAVGMYGGEATLSIATMVLRSVSVEGSYVGSHAEMGALMTLVRERGVPALPIVQRPFAAVNVAMDEIRAGRVVGRTVLVAAPRTPTQIEGAS